MSSDLHRKWDQLLPLPREIEILFNSLTDTSVGLQISLKLFKLCPQILRTSMFHFDLEVSHNFYLFVNIQHEEITIGAK